jgi:hypothetical protein
VTVGDGRLPAAAAVVGGVVTALLAVVAAGRRAARIPPATALADATVEPERLGPGRIVGGLLALAGAAPLLTVAATTDTPSTAAPTSELAALFLAVAVAFLGFGLVIVAAALLPLSHALDGGFHPSVPGRPLAAILGISAGLAFVGLTIPTRRAAAGRE